MSKEDKVSEEGIIIVVRDDDFAAIALASKLPRRIVKVVSSAEVHAYKNVGIALHSACRNGKGRWFQGFLAHVVIVSNHRISLRKAKRAIELAQSVQFKRLVK
jgi:hypothetical protein